MATASAEIFMVPVSQAPDTIQWSAMREILAGWQPPPDYDLLKPMDEAARKALQASIDAKRAESRGDAHGLPGGLPERVEIEIWRR